MLPWFGPPVVKYVTSGRRQAVVEGEVVVRPWAAVGREAAIEGEVVVRPWAAVGWKAVVAGDVAVRPGTAIRPWLTERPEMRPVRLAPVATHRAGISVTRLRSYLLVMAIAVVVPVG